MANGNGLTAAEMIDALKETKGYVVDACKILKCSRSKFYIYYNKYATVREALDDIREDRHEYVENKLMRQIDNNNITAIIFYLKTQGKHLGYVERQEYAGVKDAPLYIVNWDEPADSQD